MRLYFPAPEISSFSLDSSLEMQLNANECELLKQTLNKRASYLSVQNIYGDAILAVVGYTRRSSGFLYKHVSLSTYYRCHISANFLFRSYICIFLLPYSPSFFMRRPCAHVVQRM